MKTYREAIIERLVYSINKRDGKTEQGHRDEWTVEKEAEAEINSWSNLELLDAIETVEREREYDAEQASKLAAKEGHR